MKVLIIDNYDSFVYNLAQYVGLLGGEPIVYRNDQISLEEALGLDVDRIIISPGPGHPADVRSIGISRDILLKMSPKIPTLGICLGHQAIAQVYGGRVGRARRLLHGKTSWIDHDGRSIYRGLPRPLEATRYHSLAVKEEGLPNELLITARALEDGEVMGIRHKSHPIEGVQFHPESILTKAGLKMLRNFLRRGVEA